MYTINVNGVVQINTKNPTARPYHDVLVHVTNSWNTPMHGRIRNLLIIGEIFFIVLY